MFSIRHRKVKKENVNILRTVDSGVNENQAVG